MPRSLSASPRLVLVRPAPGPDEVFSSWITRVALANGLRPPGLLLALGTGRVLQGDPDVSLPDSVLRRLAVLTQQPEDRVLQTSLRPLITPDSGGPPLVSPRAFLVFQGRGNGGPRARGHPVCLACLAETGQLQRCWRLITTVICPVHRVALTDRCPRCGHPVNPLRAHLARATRRKLPTAVAPQVCLRCLQIMRPAPAPPPEVCEAALAVQGWTERALQGRAADLRDIHLPAADFFALLTVLTALVGQRRDRQGRHLEFSPAFEVPAFTGAPYLGLASPAHRLPIMARCGELLGAGLVPLLRRLMEAEIGPRELLPGKLGTALRPWLNDLIIDTLSKRPHGRQLLPVPMGMQPARIRFSDRDWTVFTAQLPVITRVRGAGRRIDDRVILQTFLGRSLAGETHAGWQDEVGPLAVFRRLQRLQVDGTLELIVGQMMLLLEHRLGCLLPGTAESWSRLSEAHRRLLLALLAPGTVRTLRELGNRHASVLWQAGATLSLLGAHERLALLAPPIMESWIP